MSATYLKWLLFMLLGLLLASAPYYFSLLAGLHGLAENHPFIHNILAHFTGGDTTNSCTGIFQ